MDKKIIELGDALMVLTTAEAILLQEYLESKGLKPAQPAIVAAASAPVEETKESANVNIIIVDKGAISTISLVKPLMKVIGKNAMDTKRLVDALPATVMENIPREQAKAIISELINEIGSDLKINLQDC